MKHIRIVDDKEILWEGEIEGSVFGYFIRGVSMKDDTLIIKVTRYYRNEIDLQYHYVTEMGFEYTSFGDLYITNSKSIYHKEVI